MDFAVIPQRVPALYAARETVLVFAMLARVLIVLALLAPVSAQRRSTSTQIDDQTAEAELLAGITLTRKGQFAEALPHLEAASQGRVRDEYAAGFNLALCYVGTRQYKLAIAALTDMRGKGRDTAELETLLAQAYIGGAQPDAAFAAVERSARLAPKAEKLYLFALDACMDSGYDELGMKIVDLALHNLPNSARLLFERATFLAELDQFDQARKDFDRARSLAPGTDIAYIAAAEENFYDGNMTGAMRAAREGIEKGNLHFLLLSIYGEAVLRAGIAPDRPEFADAVEALQRVIADHPNYASAQLSLGRLYLEQGRIDDAIARLEAARSLDPQNPAVYSNLAAAYRRRGNSDKAQEALAVLERINRQQVEKIGSAPGERKAGYASRVAQQPRPPQ